MKLVANAKDYQKLVSKLNFVSEKIFRKKILAVKKR